jgi:hypothetical protein
MKSTAVVAEMEMFAADPNINGVSYANVDECGLYPSDTFFGGYLVNTSGPRTARSRRLPPPITERRSRATRGARANAG